IMRKRQDGGRDSSGAEGGPEHNPSYGTGSSHSGLLDKWKIDDKPVKTDKWDVSAVKNSLNDSAKMYKYVENFGSVTNTL
uniref:Uncharacterized protein n=1 Tax=Monodon monoceros TaxID=40151 RepID=A0A8C6CL52_MONMO